MRLKIFQEKRKAEEALSELKQQYDTEVGDLQVTIKKLKKASGHSESVLRHADLMKCLLQER